MRKMSIASAICLSLGGLSAFASDLQEDSSRITFSVEQRFPATITLYAKDGKPQGRRTPIYNNYRPKISFGGSEIVCMFYVSPKIKQIAPGETAPVSLSCKEAITIPNAGARFVVKEGGKEVGFGTIAVVPSS